MTTFLEILGIVFIVQIAFCVVFVLWACVHFRVFEKPKDVSELAGGFPEDEDIDAFLKDIYDARNTL